MRSGAGRVSAGRKAGFIEANRWRSIVTILCARGVSFGKKLTHDFTGSPWRVPPGYNTNEGEESRQ
jgi:hypothetical protein